MNWLVGIFGSIFIALIQSLPLTVVARIGRAGGAIAWVLDRRHRKIALQNLERVFGQEKTDLERLAIARENFRRLGENYLTSIKTPVLSAAEMAPHIEIVGFDGSVCKPGKSMVVAIGHFGNFEVFARAKDQVPNQRIATTYRALNQPALDALFLQLRKRSGVEFFERRSQARELKQFLASPGGMLGILGDQHAGDRGLWLPFFGIECSCSASTAVFALRYNATLRSAFCFRTRLAHWRLEMGPEIPTTHPDGTPRTPEELTRDINTAYEAAIRRDPANWFWVHRRWKPMSKIQERRRAGATNPMTSSNAGLSNGDQEESP